MTIEQRLEQLEKRNKCLPVALTMTVVAMAATGDKTSGWISRRSATSV